MNELIPTMGANKSAHDRRTVSHERMKTFTGAPLITGGHDYLPDEIEHQHNVGICTAISITQNAKKAIGRPFSADFQYLLQKKYYDLDWKEGSSIFSALKVGKNYGFLPAELWTLTTEADRSLPYDQYIAKLQSATDSYIQDLISECSDYKLTGYAQIDVTDLQAIAKAINDSRSGILCRYKVGKEWYTSIDGRTSWNPVDINPLRPPQVVISGHAITGAKFDLTTNTDITLANTWGKTWNKQGLGDAMFNVYSPTEAWIPYYGLTEVQTEELKQKLIKRIGLLQQLISLWKQLKELTIK